MALIKTILRHPALTPFLEDLSRDETLDSPILLAVIDVKVPWETAQRSNQAPAKHPKIVYTNRRIQASIRCCKA
jgi:hypothetical protein